MNPIITPVPGVDPYYAANQLDFLTAPTAGVLRAMAEESFVRNPVPTIFRAFERASQLPRNLRQRLRVVPGTTPPPVEMLSAEAANERYGIEGELSFDGPTPATTAADLNQLKRDEVRRRDAMARRGGGFLETASMFGVGLGVSALDPLNIASAFVPVVGPARVAAMLARAASPLGRAGVRAGIGALEGAAGAALVEPIIYAGARAEQADYDAADSLLNLAFGTALGGGLHVAGGAIGDVIRARVGGRPAIPADAGSLSGNAGRFEAAPIEQQRAELGAGVAQLVETGTVRGFDRVVAAERAEIDRLYDFTLGNLLAAADAMVVRMKPEHLDEVLLAKGPALLRPDGSLMVQGAGLRAIGEEPGGRGMVKIMVKHGELSPKAGSHLAVTRDDVLALPLVLRALEPVGYARHNATGGIMRMSWVRQDDAGRRVRYSVRRMAPSGPFDTVSIHVLRDTDRTPVSLSRTVGGTGASPSLGGVNTEDTPGGIPARPLGGEAPAPRNIGPIGPADNPDAGIPAAAEAAVKEGEARQADPEQALTEEVAALEAELGALDPASLAGYARDPDAGPLDPARLAGLTGAEERQVRHALDRLAARGAIRKLAPGKYRRNPRGGPLDLLEFIAATGGLMDSEGHLLVASRDAQRFIPRFGALIRKTGDSVDGMGERLWEAGYFGHPDSTPRPDEGQVLALLDEALAGRKIYSARDLAEVAEREAAKATAGFKAEAKTMQAEIAAAAEAMGEPLSKAELRAIAERAVDERLDAEEALTDHVERLALESADAIRADTGRVDIEEEIPFEPLESREDGGLARGERDGAEGQAGDEGEGTPGRAAAAEDREAAFAERTDQGEQLVARGLTAPVSPRARAEIGMAGRSKAKSEQRGVDGLGLFDEDARASTNDLFATDPAIMSAEIGLHQADDMAKAVEAAAGCLARRGGA